MKVIEKIYNSDDLTLEHIDENTTRARAILINSSNEVLMCYSNGLTHYEFPGGHLEKNETLLEGLKREILEETGITIDANENDLFYAIKYYCKNYKGTEKNRLVEIYYYVIYCETIYEEARRQLDSNEIIQNYEVETQEDLARYLTEAGYAVTQATVSRDIRELSLEKVPGRQVKQKYAMRMSSVPVSEAVRPTGQTPNRYASLLQDGIVLLI